METKENYVYLEVMRIIACFFVIFNHTGDNGFSLFAQYNWGEPQYWCYMFISVFCKFSVPLFFAISGALLLTKTEEAISVVWKRRITRIVLVLIIFSFFYYCKRIYTGKEVFDIDRFLLKTYDSGWNFSYWYLYAYIAFLISIPILRKMACAMEDKHYYYMFVLIVVFNGIRPIMEYLLWKGEHSLNSKLSMNWLAESIVFYPLLGYFLQHRLKDIDKKGKYICVMWVVDVITILACCYTTYVEKNIIGEYSENYYSSFAMINMVTIFVTIKYFYVKYGAKFPKWFEKMICSIGGCTFGIYLWHVFVMGRIKGLYDILQNNLGLNYMIAAFCFCFVVLLISYGITWIMKKMPFLKKLV